MHAYLPTALHGVGRMVSLRAGVGLPFSPNFFIMGLSFLTGLSFYWGYIVGRSGLVSACCGATLRVHVFLKYVLIEALSNSSAPGPSGDRGDMPLMVTRG